MYRYVSADTDTDLRENNTDILILDPILSRFICILAYL